MDGTNKYAGYPYTLKRGSMGDGSIDVWIDGWIDSWMDRLVAG